MVKHPVLARRSPAKCLVTDDGPTTIALFFRHSPSVLNRAGSLCSGCGVRPMIGMATRSQHPRRDRPRHHKGVDVSHPRCIMVSSRKHHRSVLRYRPDRDRDHVVGADPSQGMAGRVREPRRWWLGVGPLEGSGPAFFAFSVPQGLPGAMAGTSRVSMTNPGIRTLSRTAGVAVNARGPADRSPVMCC